MRNTIALFWCLKMSFRISPSRFILNLLFSVINASFPVYLAVYIGELINNIYTSINTANDFSLLIDKIILLAVLLAAKVIFNQGYSLVYSSLTINDSIKLNYEFYKIFRNIPLINFEDSEFCDTYNNAKLGFYGILSVSNNVQDFIAALIAFIYSLIVVFNAAPWLLPLITVIFVGGYLLNMKNNGAWYKHWEESVNDKRTVSYYESLFVSKSYTKELRALGIGSYFRMKWREVTDRLIFERKKISARTNRNFALYMLIMQLSNVIVLGALIFMARGILISVGEIFTIWRLNQNTSDSIQAINGSYSKMHLSNEKMLLTLEFYSTYKNPAAQPLSLPSPTMEVEEEKDADEAKNTLYRLENVWFSYKNKPDVLKGINLTIPKGQSIALCGDNGCGKSTLVKLLLKIYEPTQGSVQLYVSSEEKEEIFGVAFQDFFNYPFTVRENIGVGDVRDINSEEKIRSAADKGDSLDIINKYGMNTLLTKTMDDTGTELSGGEWQRLALSRANMGNKPIMIFDEPTAKLDPIAELEQYRRIYSMLRTHTAILVSHRIGFARLADRIVVLENGRIVEDGSHNELIRAGGKYKSMYDEQAGWYDTSWQSR